MKPLSEQLVKQPAKQQNNFNRPPKPLKRVKRQELKLVQSLHPKNLLLVIVVVVRSHLLAQQARH
jgi:hypothetical protein